MQDSVVSEENSLRQSFANKSPYCAELNPSPAIGTSLVMPISLGRYDLSRSKTEEYDLMLASMFDRAEQLITDNHVKQVDVISTGGLQEINWDKSKVDSVEKHFYSVHGRALDRLTTHFYWDEWLDSRCRTIYQDIYQLVLEKSSPGTVWYEYMLKAHKKANMSSSLDNSLEYQRREYAAIMRMNNYDYIAYGGYISVAWAYLYHLFPERELPRFIRVSFSKDKIAGGGTSITPSDAGHTTKMLLSMLEQTLTSKNFPNAEKQKLIDGGFSLFYTNEPRS